MSAVRLGGRAVGREHRPDAAGGGLAIRMSRSRNWMMRDAQARSDWVDVEAWRDVRGGARRRRARRENSPRSGWR